MIILACCGNGYCGCDSEDVFFYEDGTAENIINEDVNQWACENAESYAYVHFGWGEDYSDEDYLDNHVNWDWHDATYEEYVEWCENWGYEPREEAMLF